MFICVRNDMMSMLKENRMSIYIPEMTQPTESHNELKKDYVLYG